MSQTSVLKFVEIAKNSESLRLQLKATTNSAQVKDLAAKNGFDLTEKEIVSYFRQAGIIKVSQDGDLSEKELEAVAGAGGSISCDIIWD